jgi:hypothetical protein
LFLLPTPLKNETVPSFPLFVLIKN